jgi:hypothetical protein
MPRRTGCDATVFGEKRSAYRVVVWPCALPGRGGRTENPSSSSAVRALTAAGNHRSWARRARQSMRPGFAPGWPSTAAPLGHLVEARMWLRRRALASISAVETAAVGEGGARLRHGRNTRYSTLIRHLFSTDHPPPPPRERGRAEQRGGNGSGESGPDYISSEVVPAAIMGEMPRATKVACISLTESSIDTP